jgi:hypothetical protein
MSFSDIPFGDGPFVTHDVPCRYLKKYFRAHELESLLVVNTTVEDVSKVSESPKGGERWRLTLRRPDPKREVDEWWQEEFDAVIFGNGHYSVPYVSFHCRSSLVRSWVDNLAEKIPEVKGLKEYALRDPRRVVHSKYYRSPSPYSNKRVLIIGNSASGRDLSTELLKYVQLPLYQSIRSKSRWDGDEPPAGIAWRPIVSEYFSDGRILFEDGTSLVDIDVVIYCTGYKHSFPFWNEKANGRPIWDYAENKLVNGYWHTFLSDFPTVGLVGVPRVLTFRSWEYQAVALARIFSRRKARPLPPVAEQKKWDRERLTLVKREKRKFHEIQWETGETMEWLRALFEWAGLETLEGDGRIPPALTRDVIWAIEHVRKYPDREHHDEESTLGDEASEWVVLHNATKDLLHFI